MAGGGSHAGGWARRALALAHTRERLLALAIVATILDALVLLPVMAAVGRTFSASTVARDISLTGQLADDAAGRADALVVLIVSTVVIGALAAAIVHAMLIGGIAGIERWTRPSVRVVLLLTVVYIVVRGAMIAVATLPETWAGAALLGALLLLVLLVYVDYAVVLGEHGLRGAVRESLSILRARPGPSLLVVSLALLLGIVLDEIFAAPMVDASDVFLPGVAALLVARSALAFLVDCALIAIRGTVVPPVGSRE